MKYSIAAVSFTVAIFLAAYLATLKSPEETPNSSDGEVLWTDDGPPIYYKEGPS